MASMCLESVNFLNSGIMYSSLKPNACYKYMSIYLISLFVSFTEVICNKKSNLMHYTSFCIILWITLIRANHGLQLVCIISTKHGQNSRQLSWLCSATSEEMYMFSNFHGEINGKSITQYVYFYNFSRSSGEKICQITHVRKFVLIIAEYFQKGVVITIWSSHIEMLNTEVRYIFRSVAFNYSAMFLHISRKNLCDLVILSLTLWNTESRI